MTISLSDRFVERPFHYPTASLNDHFIVRLIHYLKLYQSDSA
ncbi:MAG: hypothetical protein SPE88_00140 [Paludibacteraceae bacterium]|nr:hypothetical protein [Paludibacteraceae bacterium]